ncbi:hypothetical protein O9992_13655 [Vibrio lentus]|nr:hypothetical protein [Vibrio lentus]
MVSKAQPYLGTTFVVCGKENNVVVAVCAAIESELSELDDEDREEF